MSKRCAVLIGMMGAGKTEVGEMLADRLGYSFIDTDNLLVEQTGMSIPEVFREQGEAGFRQLEREIVHGLVGTTSAVIAAGGGAILDEDNRRVFQSLGHLVYLKASARELYLRIKNDRNRPLLQVPNPEAEIARLLRDRSAAYKRCDITIDTEELGVDEVVSVLIDEIAKRTRKNQPE